MEAMESTLDRAPRMRIHFNVHEPVELVEMTLAFQGLGFEYQAFLKRRLLKQESKENTSNVKLYVTRIETNCILAELAPALPMLGSLMPVLSDVNTVHDFVQNMAKSIRWLKELANRDSVSAKDVTRSKRHLQHVRDMVQLVGKGRGSELGLATIRYEASSGQDRVLLEATFTDEECRQAAQGATRALAALEHREKADFEKVLMYFYQTNIEDPKALGKTGDKAVITHISPEPLNVYIIPETDRSRVRHVLDDKTHNPLHTGFVVDVNVEKSPKGKPRIYRVVRLHEIVYDDD